MRSERKKPGDEHAGLEEAVAQEMDKVTEERMAELLGITLRALQTRRQRGKIPEGVWNKNGRTGRHCKLSKVNNCGRSIR